MYGRMIDERAIGERYGALRDQLDERGLDTNTYEKGIKVTKAEMATLNLHRDTFHPEWNYTIEPRPQT